MSKIHVPRDITKYMCNIFLMDMMYCLPCANELWAGILPRGGVVSICGGSGSIGMYRPAFIKDT